MHWWWAEHYKSNFWYTFSTQYSAWNNQLPTYLVYKLNPSTVQIFGTSYSLLFLLEFCTIIRYNKYSPVLFLDIWYVAHIKLGYFLNYFLFFFFTFYLDLMKMVCNILNVQPRISGLYQIFTVVLENNWTFLTQSHPMPH